ncbi:polysaccharide biosynthesis protein [Simiduia aestuariiviva]|uniref:FlaA1/EpsC-like NDP-sugar epimerase n=1 Tax=Simiduia aestuariiviva TaxID=1510459 RepID=A0A839UL29_9GAMM|nr:nucleoside-diphosphate sugar epimerase/dehydratase [Simiduia aestuariiviva]MBB3168353.1 FlaA1/EpsC-like NDP-sugar epimerase [Simiduia aestuariiviva]
MTLLIQYFLKSPRWFKRSISIAYDLLAIYVSFLSAWALRVGKMGYEYSGYDLLAVAIATAATIFVFIRLGLYRAVLRYVTQDAFITIALGICLSALVMAAASFMLGGNMPRSVPVIYGCVAFITIGAPRILFRSIIFWLNPTNKEPVLIYGAGETGSQIAWSLQMGDEYHPVAFIDDSRTLQQSSIRGVHVYPPSQLGQLVDRFQPTTLLLAIGEQDKTRLADIVKSCAPFNLRIATIPKVGELINGKASSPVLREVKISDVLGREPVAPIPRLLTKNVEHKVVMVTGAGGSIGSQISEQVLALNPKKLILFDNSEYNLYKLNEQLSCHKDHGLIKLVLGDIRNEKSIGDTIAEQSPQTIFHAAAYKHVPMVEANVWEGIRNNAYGTLLAARSAMENNVENFVLISTDKAVRPTNVMGATKRFAELILQSLQYSPENTNTCFSAVRFGNVLDSSGSVIPKFREQIAAGGPVTVTHPEVTRYFMTLQESAQLVIQASAMCKGGDIFVLDMGEPVRILDLAKEMIALSFSGGTLNNKPHPKIEIVGLRPGEKLYEELLLTKQCSGTEHPRIWIDTAHSERAPLGADLPARLEQAISEKNIPVLEQLILSRITGYQHPLAVEDNKEAPSNIYPITKTT